MKNFQDLTVHDYLRTLRRRIWYLVIPAIVVSIAAGIYVWRMPSIYKSETTILVSDRFLPEDYIGSLVRQSAMDRMEFAKQQLRSRTFVERIAQEFQLVGNGANTEGVLNAVINNTEITVMSPNVFKIGFYSIDPNTAQAVTRRLAERVTQSNSAVRQEKVSVADQFLEEQLHQAADDLAKAEQKLRDFNQSHFPGAPENVNTDSLNSVEAQLTSIETDLQAATDQRKAYERSLSEHKDLRLAVKTPRPITPAAPAPSVAAPAVAPPISPLQAKLAEKKAELAGLLTRYTPEHPDVARVTREIRDLASQAVEATPSKPAPSVVAPPAPAPQPELNPLPEVDMTVDFYEAEVRHELDLLNREIAKKEATKTELSNKLTAYTRRTRMPAEVMEELAALTQDRDSAKERHSYLANKKLSSDLAGRVDTDSSNKMFTTIDPPNLPQTPVRPDRGTLTAVGCLAGLMLGFGLAFAREILDPTLTDEDSALAELKLPILTSIPMVEDLTPKEKKPKPKWREKGDRKGNPLTLSVPVEGSLPSSEVSLQAIPRELSIQGFDARVRDVIRGSSLVATEQFQMMRAELIAQRQRGLKTVIVTSAVPGEGKTFVACCLAGILAKEPGRKVLLVDGDLRTGHAGQVMGLRRRDSVRGLYEVLTGQADVENCLIPCPDLNLSLLPTGYVTDNPVDLLSSPRLQQVIRDFTLLFDWIIIDAPPIVPIADTNLLMPIGDMAIVVVRADKTPSRLVKDAINKVGREKVSGIVLNGVRQLKSSNYYYGHYYDSLTATKK